MMMKMTLILRDLLLPSSSMTRNLLRGLLWVALRARNLKQGGIALRASATGGPLIKGLIWGG